MNMYGVNPENDWENSRPVTTEEKQKFAMIQGAFALDRAGLLICEDRETGKEICVICAFIPHPSGKMALIPLAKLFEKNPYEELVDPTAVKKPDYDMDIVKKLLGDLKE